MPNFLNKKLLILHILIYSDLVLYETEMRELAFKLIFLWCRIFKNNTCHLPFIKVGIIHFSR